MEGRKGQTKKLGASVPADWADRLGCARPGRLASLRLRAEGIPGVLSPDANCGVIYTADPHQILWCSYCRHLLGNSHFEGAKSLYQ